jgi:choline dehydrogenase
MNGSAWVQQGGVTRIWHRTSEEIDISSFNSQFRSYFRKSEKFTPSARSPNIRLEDRGDSGPWQTGFFHWSQPMGERFLQACEEIGIPSNPCVYRWLTSLSRHRFLDCRDLNTARGTLGVARVPSFIDSKGQRSSAATAYLTKSVRARRNFTIAIETVVSLLARKNIAFFITYQVTRILFNEGGTPRAYGVEVGKKDSSQRYRVLVRKEVILCAGAINTPQILNLSGIGSKQELDSLGIKLVKELPAVGKHLAEVCDICSSHFRNISRSTLQHIACSVKLRAKKGTLMNYMSNDWWSLFYLVYWLFTGRGPLTSLVLIHFKTYIWIYFEFSRPRKALPSCAQWIQVFGVLAKGKPTLGISIVLLDLMLQTLNLWVSRSPQREENSKNRHRTRTLT